MAATPGVIFAGKPTQVETGTHNGARNKPNEDRFDAFVGPGNNGQPAQFLVVADGVTSTHGGERASDIAVRVLRRLLQSPATSSRAPKPLRARLADAINAANQEILETARKDPDLKGMSTTLVVAAIDGDQLTLMHLGDSRAYLIRSGKAYQLTRDHTWVQDAMDEGRITPEQARTHPNRHVIQRYLGDARGVSIDDSILDPARPLENPDQTEMSGPTPRPGDTTLTLRPGDALLLCSDGLYNRISDEEIAAAATKYAPEKAVKSLIEQAVKRDEPDNITIVFWPTGGAPVVAAAATRRPVVALALAAAGVVLALAAVWFIVGQSGGQQAGPPPGGEVVAVVAAATASAEVAATVQPPPDAMPTPEPAPDTPTVAPTDTATVPATATALPTDTPPAQPTDAEASPITRLPTAGSAGEAAVPLPPTVTAVVDGQQSAPAATLTAAALAVAEAQAQATADAATSVAADPTQTLAATNTPAAGARATSTPISTPTVSPTPTSTMTRTPQPTRTPTPATTGATPAASPAGSASNDVGGPRAATILQPLPADGHSSNTPTIFSWRADAELAPGQEFEVIFWNPLNQTVGQGGGWAESSPATSVTIPADKRAQGTYNWALFLVTRNPYDRLRMLAGPFTFSVPGSGGEPGPGPNPMPPPEPPVPPEPPEAPGDSG